jgi:hypothetical protein
MTTPSAEPPAPRLLDRLRTELRSRHYSRRTEQAYVLWTRRFVRRDLADLGTLVRARKPVRLPS